MSSSRHHRSSTRDRERAKSSAAASTSAVAKRAPSESEVIVEQIKASGKFDELRNSCLKDVDYTPAYNILKDKVERFVAGFLSTVIWTPQCKNSVREKLRRELEKSGLLEDGVQHIVDQSVNRQRISREIYPEIEASACQHLGLESPPADLQARLSQDTYQQSYSFATAGTSYRNAQQHVPQYAGSGRAGFQTNSGYHQQHWRPRGGFRGRDSWVRDADRRGDHYGSNSNNRGHYNNNRHYNNRPNRPMHHNNAYVPRRNFDYHHHHSQAAYGASASFVQGAHPVSLPDDATTSISVAPSSYNSSFYQAQASYLNSHSGSTGVVEDIPAPQYEPLADSAASHETVIAEVDMEIEDDKDVGTVIEETTPVS